MQVGACALIGQLSTLLGVRGDTMTQPDLVPRGLSMRQAVVVSSAVAIPSALIGAAGLAQTGRNGPQT